MNVYEFIHKVLVEDYNHKNDKATNFVDTIMKDYDIWNNHACKGYLFYALDYIFEEENFELSAEIKKELYTTLDWCLDVITVDEAAQYYLDHCRKNEV